MARHRDARIILDRFVAGTFKMTLTRQPNDSFELVVYDSWLCWHIEVIIDEVEARVKFEAKKPELAVHVAQRALGLEEGPLTDFGSLRPDLYQQALARTLEKQNIIDELIGDIRGVASE